MTNYTVTVTVGNIQTPQAQFTQSVSFRTLAPPSGGSIVATASVGSANLTNITVSVKGWLSVSPPMAYSVSMADNLGEIQLLSSGWITTTINEQLGSGSNFTF
jgi:REJ domain